MTSIRQLSTQIQAQKLSVIRIAVILTIAIFLAHVHPSTAATNESLRVNMDFVVSDSHPFPVFVAGDPIWFKWSLTNITENPITIRWHPCMFTADNVDVWSVTNGIEEVIKSTYYKTLPRNIPSTTIPGRGSICLVKNLLEYYTPSGMLSGCPTSRVLCMPGEYIAAANFYTFLPMEHSNGSVYVSSKLRFRVVPFDQNQIKVMLPRVFERHRSEEDRFEMAAQLLVYLDSNERNAFIRKCLDDNSILVRKMGIVGVERYRVQECIPYVRIILEKDREAEVREYAIDALTALDPAGSVPILLKHLEKRTEGCWIAAMNALTRMKERRAVPILHAILRDSSLDADLKLAISGNIRTIEGK